MVGKNICHLPKTIEVVVPRASQILDKGRKQKNHLYLSFSGISEVLF